MSLEKKGLGIILHSGSYDRLHHGISIALAALALNRDVKLFFTYWALEYLKRKESPVFKLDGEAKEHKDILEKNIERAHLQKVSDLITQMNVMGAKLYACTSSMALLNISRDELIREVDKSMGITKFLTESVSDQIIFI
jgi:peroxiredoxin family protein